MRLALCAGLSATLILAAACATEPAPPPSGAAPSANVPAPPPPVTVSIVRGDGGEIGTARLTPAPKGVLIEITIRAGGLTPGWHGVHLHKTGLCEGPGFESASSHIGQGGLAHGLLHPQGTEAGDLPNIHALPDGSAHAEVFNTFLMLSDLQDADGSALVIHANRDDHITQPTGGSGARVACGALPR